MSLKILVFLSAMVNCSFLYSQTTSTNGAATNNKAAACINSSNLGADSYYYLQFDSSGAWFNNPCALWPNQGEEFIARFKPSCSNTYRIEFHSNLMTTVSLLIRNTGSICDSTGFTCLSVVYDWSNNLFYYDILLDSSITYDFLFDYDGSNGIIQGSIIIRTPHVTNFEAHHITPDSIGLYWNGTFDNVVLEYGKQGFIPGTDTLPGSFGTVINHATSLTFIYGLEQDSVYDFYYRDKCGNTFSANSTKRRIKIPANCDSMPTVYSGGPLINFTNYSLHTYYTGSWILGSCGGCPASSPEKILKFTPDSTGIYIMRKLSTGGTAPTLFAFYKEALLGCDEYNWNCIKAFGNSWIGANIFGPLIKDTTYYIMLKGTQEDCYPGGGISGSSFKLEGPSTCFAPVQPRIFNVATTSVFINPNCSFCMDSMYVEYGPYSFTPGTDSIPGVGGTVLHVPTTSQTIYNLQPGTHYQIYLRQFCDSVNEFSPNASPAQFTTIAACSNSPTTLTTNAPNNTICGTQSVYFSASGGILSPSGYYVWTTDSCNGPVIATGGNGSGYFTVSSTKEYFIHAQDTCGNNSCVSVTITVNPVPTVSIAPTGTISICAGDTVPLAATTAPTNTYQWFRYNILVGSATSGNYSATLAGSYYVAVTDTLGCKKNSTTTSVVVVCAPIDPSSSNLKLGNNDSVELSPEIYLKSKSEEIIITNNNDESAIIYIHNSLGQLIKTVKPHWANQSAFINISKLNPGVYFVYLLSTKQKSKSYKVNILK